MLVVLALDRVISSIGTFGTPWCLSSSPSSKGFVLESEKSSPTSKGFKSATLKIMYKKILWEDQFYIHCY